MIRSRIPVYKAKMAARIVPNKMIFIHLFLRSSVRDVLTLNGLLPQINIK